MRPALALIISSYNQADYLARVLRAVSAQTDSPDEVIVADDGSNDMTGSVFERWVREQRFVARRVWHPKHGFRRARILNLVLAQSTTPYVVFIDGDSIPHPAFVADHRGLARPGFFAQGHRALVTRSGAATFGLGPFEEDRRRALIAGQLQGLKHVFRWPRPLRRVLTQVDGVRGCNLAAWRSDLVSVNGYDEDFVGWGCEDLDLAMRLIHSGIRRLDIRGWAICYHLWHDEADRSHLASNLAILARTKISKRVRCQCGLDQHGRRAEPLDVSPCARPF